ncbi:MAG: hypothetical protein QOE54_1106 [Streptosporangiaceae bacterium]|nr:hypothetical protein [Streptosporangiaceae bacterium]MDX6428740.1 hypothetical protein [Streptosporangiaceae bacterium]
MTSDEHDLIRATAIIAVHLDDDGTVAARLADAAQETVTLVTGSADVATPPDFHRQMIRMVAELADSSGAQLVRARRDQRGWHWVAEPL